CATLLTPRRPAPISPLFPYTTLFRSIRGAAWNTLHHPDDYVPSQRFGKTLRAESSWGLLYRSARKPGGECVAVLRPRALRQVRQSGHYAYLWDGERITDVLQLKRIEID